MIAIVSHDNRIIIKPAAQRLEETPGIDAAAGVVGQPFLDPRPLVRGDAGLQRRAVAGRNGCRKQVRNGRHRVASVRVQRHGGRVIAADGGGIDVHVHQLLRGYRAEAPRADLGEAGPDGQHRITAAKGILRGGHGGRPESHPGVQRVVGRKCRQALQGGRNRGAQLLRDPADIVGNVPCTPADENAGLLRCRNQVGRGAVLESEARRDDAPPARE